VVCPEMFRGFLSWLYCSILEVFHSPFSAQWVHTRNIPEPIVFMLKPCTSYPDGLLLLRDFHKLVKKKYWRYWLHVCTIILPHAFCFSESVHILSRRVGGRQTVAREQLHNKLFWHLTQCMPLLYRSRPTPSYAVHHFACLNSMQV
jgi:hypothetical protein